MTPTRLLLLICLLAPACASFPHPAPEPRRGPPEDDLAGFVTLAPTAETGPYGADPLKSRTRGAPPR